MFAWHKRWLVVALLLAVCRVVIASDLFAIKRTPNLVILATDVAPTLDKEIISKKRVGPRAVPLVVHRGVRYEVIHWGKAQGFSQNGGYIRAVNHTTGQELWVLKIYDVRYVSDIEDDKQDIFITSLKLSRDTQKLEVENERGQKFSVDIVNRKVFNR
jgi:hypothetical protein